MTWVQDLNTKRPNQIFGSDLLHWYNPSSIVDAGNGTCSQWSDVGSSANYHLTQATSAYRPTIASSTNIFNGENHIYFVSDGTSNNYHTLTNSSFSSGTDKFILFMVCKISTNYEYSFFIDSYSTSVNGPYVWAGARPYLAGGVAYSDFNFAATSGSTLATSQQISFNRTNDPFLMVSQWNSNVANGSSRSFYGNNFIFIKNRFFTNVGSTLPYDSDFSGYDKFNGGIMIGQLKRAGSYGLANQSWIAELGYIRTTTNKLTTANFTLLKRYILSRYNIST